MLDFEHGIKTTFDPNADAAYIRLTDSQVVESEEVRPGVIDFDEQDRVIGIEIIKLRRQYLRAADGVLEGIGAAGSSGAT